MIYEWDPSKAEANLRKHGVSFSEAATVFLDPLAMTYGDPGHSHDEPRFITFGESRQGRNLVVSHRDLADEQIRIISPRRMTKREPDDYKQQR